MKSFDQPRSATEMGAPVRIGDVLAEKYEVTRILGTGGMGVVVAARNVELDKLVALKFMHEEVSSNEHITRFMREARAAARLQNEHVVSVLDIGRLPNGVPYIVMEYLEGEDLGQLLERRGPLEVADAVEYLLQVCEAMAEAHALGIIHRDLKPQNLFLTIRQDGRPLVKVLDFGISKGPFLHSSTATSQVMGSPAYMAPEQIRSARSVDARADIWSLGVLLYQLLSNTLPFAGETSLEIMYNVLSLPPPRLGSIRTGLPHGLVSAIERCLEKEPERRFANVAELSHDLMPFTPERARAAISLIEHVMMAGALQSSSLTADSEFTAMIPGTRAMTHDVPIQISPSYAKTTLTTAVSSVSGSEHVSRRWLQRAAIAVVGMAASVIVLRVIMDRSGTSSAPAPTQETAIVLDASVVAADEGNKFTVPFDAASDAAINALTEVGSDVPQDAMVGRRTMRSAPAHKVVVDAGVVPVPEPLVLEPARTDEKPLSPAR